MCQWMSATFRPRVGVRNENETARRGVTQNGIELLFLVGSSGEVPISEIDGDFVPRADAGSVGIRKVWDDGSVQLDEWRRVIHYRCAILYAGRKIVRQAQRVANFMRGQLAHSR